MPLLDDVAAQLETDGMGTVKTNVNNPSTWPIFKGTLVPGNTDDAIFLIAGPGEGVIDEMGSTRGAVAAEIPSLVVSVRNADISAAISKAEAIWLKLHKFSGTLSGTRYLLIEARHKPFAIGRDESNRHMVECNYRVTKDVG